MPSYIMSTGIPPQAGFILGKETISLHSNLVIDDIEKFRNSKLFALNQPFFTFFCN